jgi:HSP20 family protein
MYDPFEYMRRMQQEMDDAFDRFFSRSYRRPLLTSGQEGEKAGKSVAVREPLLDILDEKDHYKVVVEIPGIDKKDLKINVTEDNLTIQAEVKEEKKEEEKGYFYQERRYGSFQRSIALPGDVIPEETSAECKNGILEVKLKKKSEPKTKQHKVEVK